MNISSKSIQISHSHDEFSLAFRRLHQYFMHEPLRTLPSHIRLKSEAVKLTMNCISIILASTINHEEPPLTWLTTSTGQVMS